MVSPTLEMRWWDRLGAGDVLMVGNRTMEVPMASFLPNIAGNQRVVAHPGYYITFVTRYPGGPLGVTPPIADRTLDVNLTEVPYITG